MGLIAAYDVSLVVASRIRVDVGRFSHGALGRIRILSGPRPDRTSPLVSIGSFCECAIDCLILVGGEHRNVNLFNQTLGQFGAYYKTFMSPEDRVLCETVASNGIILGDDVVVSTRATVLDGSHLGDGSLLGAGAVLKGRTAPFSIHAGVPARFLRDRLPVDDQAKYREVDFPNVAAHTLPLLPTTALAYQRGLITLQQLRERLPRLVERPRIHATASLNPDMSIGTMTIESFSVGSEPVQDPVKVERLHRYFQQLGSSEETVDWVPDVFYAMGLVDLA
jgi:acetyltransferase-like isoleucine patch superfamily enzyme